MTHVHCYNLGPNKRPEFVVCFQAELNDVNKRFKFCECVHICVCDVCMYVVCVCMYVWCVYECMYVYVMCVCLCCVHYEYVEVSVCDVCGICNLCISVYVVCVPMCK